MTSAWVAIQRNPGSGSGRRRKHLLELVYELKRRGLRPVLFRDRERLARRLADPARSAGLVGIVAAGGDGTIADVVNRYPGRPVCPFPLGTENVLCRRLGIRADGAQVAEMLARGRTRLFDVGESGSRRFLLMASAGFDAEVIHRLHIGRRGNISHWSYLTPLLAAMSSYQWPQYRVFLDEAAEPVCGGLVVVSNFDRYAMGLRITPQALPDDELFNVCVFPQRGLPALMRDWFQVARGTHLKRADVIAQSARRVRIEVTEPGAPAAWWQADGDPAGTLPCELTIRPGGMELFVP